MGFLIIFFLFIIWRGIDFLILYFVPKFIPYLGFFPYKEILPLFHLPDWLTKLANFDGVHYLLISQQGYMQYEQAYFPLYPLLIKLLTFVTNNSFISGFIVSNVGFLLGLWMIYKYLFQINRQKSENIRINQKPEISDKSEFFHLTPNSYLLTIIFLLVFPTSFFFGAIYTEGLFFFLFIGTLYFLKNKNYFLAGIFAFFASLTRLIGVFLIIPIIFEVIKNSKFPTSLKLRGTGKSQNFNSKFKSIFSILYTPFLILILSPLFGLFTYCVYLWRTTGDPLYFLSSQPIFGAHRSTNLILLPQVYWRYIKILFTATHDFQYWVSLIELTIFTLVFIVLIIDLFNNLKFISKLKFKIKNSDKFALNLFSFANLLLPTLTGTFSSIPRYALFSISFFIFLATIKNKLVKTFIVILFALCHIIMLAFFGQGYFVG